MNSKAYNDGIASVREPEKLCVHKTQRAIEDCREMGWHYLESYMQGKLDAVQKHRETSKQSKES